MKGSRIGLLFVVLVVAIFGLKFFLRPQPQKNALQARALATRALGHYLADTQAGQKVLVLSNPFTKRAGTDRAILETEEAGLRGLREGLGTKLPINAVVLPELRPSALDDPRAIPIDTETTTPLSYLVAPGAFDTALREHPGSGLLVSLIGLPAELERCEAWQTTSPTAFALLWPDLRMVGGTTAVVSAVKSGKLRAFVARKPGGRGDDLPLAQEEKEEFDQRFLLVNKSNIDQILQSYPGLF